MPANVTETEYRCPGQRQPISRSIHLGRLARFDPGCRECPHRHETGSLSAAVVRQWTAIQRRDPADPRWLDDSVAGVLWNQIDPPLVRRLAAAFGILLMEGREKRVGGAPPGSGVEETAAGTDTASARGTPRVLLAGDGRAIAAELGSAACDGLRWAGCEVLELGAASAPALAWARSQLQAEGGLLIGNPLGRPETAGLCFWASAGRIRREVRPGTAACPEPATGLGLDQLEGRLAGPLNRPARRSGGLRRHDATASYLALFREHYHALRPLRFLLDIRCAPVEGYLKELLTPVGCTMVAGRVQPDRPGAAMAGQEFHFAAIIDRDGQRLRVFDEQARPVEMDRLLSSPAHRLVAGEEDALMTLTCLLERLSQTDAPLSEVAGLAGRA